MEISSILISLSVLALSALTAWLTLSRRLSIKYFVIATHMTVLIAIYWSFRDFPSLNGPISFWWRATTDAWTVIGVLGVIGLLMSKAWAKWVVLTFYVLVAGRMLFMVQGFFVQGGTFDQIFLEYLLVTITLCFPLVFFFGKKPVFPKGEP